MSKIYAIIVFVALIFTVSCNKNSVTNKKPTNTTPDIISKNFYGTWKIDSIGYLWPRPDAPAPYKGEGNVYMAFSNNGVASIENKSNTPIVGELLGAGIFDTSGEGVLPTYTGIYDTSPWYGTTGQVNYSIKSFYPSNEWGVAEGLPFSGSFSFTQKEEQWMSNFSESKMWLYKMVSGNNVVSIRATRAK